MPASLSGIVSRAVKKYINLNVGEQLTHYSGPVRIVRRDHDEMICTKYDNTKYVNTQEIIFFSDGELWSNRGNNLVLKFLTHRYPSLCSEEAVNYVTTLLFTPGAIEQFRDNEIEERFKEMINFGTVDEEGDSLTDDEKGRMLCFITSQLLTTLNTTHCTPLPANKFQLPWVHLNHRGDFVKLENLTGK